MNSHYEKFLTTGAVRCIDDEIPFEIPKGWEWCRLSSLCSIFTGATFRKEEANRDGIGVRILRGGNISPFKLEMKVDDLYISCNKVNESILLKRNDIVTPAVTSLESIGKMARINENMGNVTVGGFVFLLRGHLNDDWLSKYLQIAMSSPATIEFMQSITNKSGQAFYNIGKERLLTALIPIPPYNEQKRITTINEELLPIIDKYEQTQKNIDKLNAEIKGKLKKSILQEAIQGHLVPQIEEEGTAQELLEQIKEEKKRLIKEGKLRKSALSDSVIFKGADNRYYEQIGHVVKNIDGDIPFDIPKSWNWTRIKDIVQINPKNESLDDIESAFIPMEMINAGYGSSYTYDIVKWGTIKRNFVHFADGDVAFAKITPCFQNRKSVIFANLPNGIGAGTSELKVLRPYGETINRSFILHLLKSPYFVDDATFKGTANQQRILSGYLENKLFPIPPIKEQERIVNRIEQLLQLLK